jgi:hypothetical protein
MKLKRYMIAAALIMAALLPATAKEKGNNTQRVYMFGFAASFNDSIVHFTEIHPVDSVVLNKKTNFLEGRESYSSQLRNYMTQQMQMPYRTCVVFYDRKAGRLQKTYLKMKRLYTPERKGQSSHNDVRTIGTDEFRFKAVDMNITTE